jgi:hypothetical protein
MDESYQERMAGVKYAIIEYINKRRKHSICEDYMNGGATTYYLEELDKSNEDDNFTNMFLLDVI